MITKETHMTQHSGIMSGFLHNFKRMFEPAPPATVSPAHGADERRPLDQEVKNLELTLQQLRQRAPHSVRPPRYHHGAQHGPLRKSSRLSRRSTSK
jgi:hypothetical protein